MVSRFGVGVVGPQQFIIWIGDMMEMIKCIMGVKKMAGLTDRQKERQVSRIYEIIFFELP